MGNRIVVMGASHGGVQAWMRLVADLPETFAAPILIVQHVPAHSPSMLPQILSRVGRLPAMHPRDREVLKPGTIYVAPPDRHMLVEGDHIRLSRGPKETFSRPAIDPLFRSAAVAFGPRVVGAVLTGELDDGTAGLMTIADAGGTTLVQDPGEALASSMPRSALRHVAVDHCCGLETMGKLLTDLAADPAPAPEGTCSRLIELETRIAAGSLTAADGGRLENVATAGGLNCPDCMAALYELSDPRFLRFRCRAGHALSAESLLAAQQDARERMLSSMFSALLEEASLARRLAQRSEYAADVAQRARLEAQVARLERQAEELREHLRGMTGLKTPLRESADTD